MSRFFSRRALRWKPVALVVVAPLLAFCLTAAAWAQPPEPARTEDDGGLRQVLFGEDDPPRPPAPPSVQLGPSGEYDLSKAVLRALAANPRMASIRAQYLGAEEAIRASRAAFGFATNLTYSYQHSGDNAGSTSGLNSAARSSTDDLWLLNLNVNQPLFTGFNLLASWQRARLSRDQAVARVRDTELALTLEVQTAFLTLLRAREDVRSAEDAVARLRSQFEVAKAFFEVGLRPKLDVLQAEADLANAEQLLTAARNTERTQTVRLNTLLNLPYSGEAKYVGDLGYLPFRMTSDEAVNLGLRNRPDLEIARKAVHVAEKDVTIAAAPLYPQVRAEFDYDRQGDDPAVSGTGTRPRPEGDSWSVGATMNWQVFDFGRTRAGVRQAEQNVSRIQADLANQIQEATFEISSNYLAIDEARERITSARAGLEAAREAYRQAVARYQAQVGTNTDVLDAQARLTQAEAGLTRAMADHMTALARLFRSVGRSNPDLTLD